MRNRTISQRQRNRETDRERERQRERERGREREADRQTGRESARERERKRERQRSSETYAHSRHARAHTHAHVHCTFTQAGQHTRARARTHAGMIVCAEAFARLIHLLVPLTMNCYTTLSWLRVCVCACVRVGVLAGLRERRNTERSGVCATDASCPPAKELLPCARKSRTHAHSSPRHPDAPAAPRSAPSSNFPRLPPHLSARRPASRRRPRSPLRTQMGQGRRA